MNPARYRVLIVEDDLVLTEVLEFALTRAGYAVLTAADGEEGYALWRAESPDLVLIDVTMPRLNGLDLARRIQGEMNTPFIIISARTSEEDILNGFDLGADDYVTKPFSVQQLLARIKAVLRRSEVVTFDDDRIALANGTITLDPTRQLARCGNHEIRLTPIETRILRLLLERANAVVESHVIIEEIWGYTSDNINALLKTHMHNLRRKLQVNPKDPDPIRTIPGVGYMLTAK